jgi:hypothetical protein
MVQPDSPTAREDPRLTIADLFVFRGENGTALVMDVNSAKPEDRSPGFAPDGRYEFKIDLDGDEVEDITYRFAFGEPDDEGRQPMELHRLTGPEARGDVVQGALVARGRTESGDVQGEGGFRMWAGCVHEPFYVEPTVLGAVRTAVEGGEQIDLGDWQPADAVNAFADSCVDAIVLEVPDSEFEDFLRPDREIGVWGTTNVASDDDLDGWRRVDRGGLPMVQLIFNQDPTRRACRADAVGTADADRIVELVSRLVRTYGTVKDPQAYAEQLGEAIRDDILHYQVGSSASYGFGGRNGRALSDNVPELMFCLLTNTALSAILTKQDATGTLSEQFPYLAAAAR